MKKEKHGNRHRFICKENSDKTNEGGGISDNARAMKELQRRIEVNWEYLMKN